MQMCIVRSYVLFTMEVNKKPHYHGVVFVFVPVCSNMIPTAAAAAPLMSSMKQRPPGLS